MYGSRKYPYPPPPTEGILALDPHPPGISIPGGICQTPPPTPWDSQFGLAPTRKTISIENAVALYYYAKDD